MDCNFCGYKISKGTEFIYVTSKGKALYFCSSKCFNNMVGLDRKPRETPWTREYRVEKEARLKLLGQAATASKAKPKKERVKPKEEAVKGKEHKGPEPHKKETKEPKQDRKEEKTETAKKNPKGRKK